MEKLLTTEQVAEICSISYSGLCQILAKDEGPTHTLVGKSRRFSIVHINEWLESNKKGTSKVPFNVQGQEQAELPEEILEEPSNQLELDFSQQPPAMVDVSYEDRTSCGDEVLLSSDVWTEEAPF